MFRDRYDAGKQLAKKLHRFKDSNVVILAIPRGGLPLGRVLANELNAPLHVALTKKIGHPFHKEYAIGAVSLENEVLSDTHGISEEYLEIETARIRNQLKEKYNLYYPKSSRISLKDKIVIITDDGIATGNTIMATVALLKNEDPAGIIVAIPVASRSAVRKLEGFPGVSELICLKIPYNFHAVGQFYVNFQSVSDDEAVRIFNEGRQD